MAAKKKVEEVSRIEVREEERTLVWMTVLISGSIFLLLGIIIGVVGGYFLLPHINYSITTQPGLYTFDFGPNAARFMDKTLSMANYSYLSNRTEVLEKGSVPIPPNIYYDGNWSTQNWSNKTYKSLGMMGNCCYPAECYPSIEDYINSTCNRNCQYPVACFRVQDE